VSKRDLKHRIQRSAKSDRRRPKGCDRHFWHLVTLSFSKTWLSQPREEWLLKDELYKGTSLLDALESMDVKTTGKTKDAEDVIYPFEDEISESLIQLGDKSAKSPSTPLLALLSPPHFEVLRKYDPRV
jgi:hypothetical protein